MTFDYNPSQKTCPDCGEPHVGLFTTCEKCLDVRAAANEETGKADKHSKEVSRWMDICPPLFRHTNWGHDGLSPVAAKYAKDWWAGSKGQSLGLYGTTGRGKTRAMYEILKRHHFAGRRVMAVTALDIQKAAQEVFSEDREAKGAAKRLLVAVRKVPILYIDDMGKEIMSPRVAGEFHGIFDHRMNWFLPTLWTSEKSGEWLARAWSEQYGDGLVRRIRQCSDIACVNPAAPESPQ